MRLALASCLAVLSVVSVAAPSLAQGVPYNRGLNPADVTYGASSSGAGFEISGDLYLYSDELVERDMGCTIRAMVNGAVVGTPVIAQVISGGPGGDCPPTFCNNCHGICFSVGRFCICLSIGGDSSGGGVARFAMPVPPLHDGDVVTVVLSPMEGSVPEIDTSDDVVTFTVAGIPPCRGDFNGDGALNSQDFFSFLTAFFALAPTADFNGDGATNSQDFFDFLGAFFAGC